MLSRHRLTTDSAAGPLAAFVLLVLLGALPGCAAVLVSDSSPRRLRAGQLDADHVVLICHGMLYDFGSSWDIALRDELEAAGVVSIAFTYWSDPTGTWFNWGCVSPGDLMAELADEIAELHRELRPGRQLILDAVGFSNGCEALLRAASKVSRARFRRFVLLHSSSFFLSTEARALVRDRRVQHLINYWSPIDVITLLAPLGAGQLGLLTPHPRIDNRMDWMPHLPHLLGAGSRREIRSNLLHDRPPQPAPSKFATALADLLSEYARR